MNAYIFVSEPLKAEHSTVGQPQPSNNLLPHFLASKNITSTSTTTQPSQQLASFLNFITSQLFVGAPSGSVATHTLPIYISDVFQGSGISSMFNNGVAFKQNPETVTQLSPTMMERESDASGEERSTMVISPLCQAEERRTSRSSFTCG